MLLYILLKGFIVLIMNDFLVILIVIICVFVIFFGFVFIMFNFGNLFFELDEFFDGDCCVKKLCGIFFFVMGIIFMLSLCCGVIIVMLFVLMFWISILIGFYFIIFILIFLIKVKCNN